MMSSSRSAGFQPVAVFIRLCLATTFILATSGHSANDGGDDVISATSVECEPVAPAVVRVDTFQIESSVDASGLRRGGLSNGRLSEILIRHGIKGTVEVKDAAADQNKIRVDVIKEADHDGQLDDITFSHRFHDNGNTVILVLNVVRAVRSTMQSILTIIGVVSSAFLAIVAGVILVWKIERRCIGPRTTNSEDVTVRITSRPTTMSTHLSVDSAMRVEGDGFRTAQSGVVFDDGSGWTMATVPRSASSSSQQPQSISRMAATTSTLHPLRLCKATTHGMNDSCGRDPSTREALTDIDDHAPCDDCMMMTDVDCARQTSCIETNFAHISELISSSAIIQYDSAIGVAKIGASSPPSAAVIVHQTPTPPPPPPPPTHVAGSREPLPVGSTADGSSSTMALGGNGSPRSASSLFRATFMMCAVLASVASGLTKCPQTAETKVTVVLWIPISIQLDVEQVLPTERAPCRPEVVCPITSSPSFLSSSQSLLIDCELGSASCVCQRGYVLVDGRCVDHDECIDDVTRCGQGASCENSDGSFACRCRPEYFLQLDSCRACAPACPEGFFESVSCSAYGDRICTACSSCGLHEYEAVPCHTDRDRLCLHAAHPLLSVANETVGVSIEDTNRLETWLQFRRWPRETRCRESRWLFCYRSVFFAMLIGVFAVFFVFVASRHLVKGISRTLTPAKRRKRLRIEQSDNLFVENLHNTRNLETTYYVTDVKQQTDFFWFRDSKIRINIGLQNINVVPVFEDVDHRGGETNFMTGSPHSEHEKDRFTEMVRRYCRHPIPDHYTVTLEVSRDRTTRARVEQCTVDKYENDSPGGARCPPGVNIGERYIRRSVSEPCEKMGSAAVPLKPAANSIVCTDDNTLLRALFNTTPTTVRPSYFPSKKCRSVISRCEQCLLHDSCQATDIFEKHCCRIDCYTLNDCKQTASEQCRSSPLECATGDAYQYTLQPVYSDLSQAYSCHLRRRRPEILYQLWFYVTVPGTNFETPRVHVQFPANGNGTDVTYGSHQATPFLTIEHSTGIQLSDDVIVTGRAAQSSGSGDVQWNYTVKPAQVDPVASHRFEVRKLANNVQVAETKFTRPFAYSTSTWVDGGPEATGCDKDVSLFVPISDAVTSQTNEVPVSASIRPSKKPPHEYLIKSTDSSPLMKFIIPANVSVLKWWFKETDSRLVLDESLDVSLSTSIDGRFSEIHVQGRMTACPGYIGMTINDRHELEEVFRCDVLVSCPPQFNVTLFVPNWLSSSTSNSPRTFDVVLDDAHVEYRVFLTTLVYDDDDDDINEPCLADQSTASAPTHSRRDAVDSARLKTTMTTTMSDKWKLVVIIASVTVSVVVFFVFIHAYLDISNHSKTVSKSREQAASRRTARLPLPNMSSDNEQFFRSSSASKAQVPMTGHRKRCRVTLCVAYATLRIVFGISLTFTVLSTALELSQRRRLNSLRVGTLLAARRDVVLNAALDRYERHLADGFGPDSVRSVRDMQLACDGYIGGLAEAVSKAVDDVIDANRMANDSSQAGVCQMPSVGSKYAPSARPLQQIFDAFRPEVQRYAAEFRRRLVRRMTPVGVRYGAFVKRFFDSVWMTYPSLLFNRTSGFSSVEDLGVSANDSGFSTTTRSFAQFVELKLGDVHMWHRRVSERLTLDVVQPRLPRLDQRCSTSGITELTDHPPWAHRSPEFSTNIRSAFSDPVSMDRMNSTRFFSASGMIEDVTGGVIADAVAITNRVRPKFESAERGTQWFREPHGPPVIDEVVRAFESYHDQMDTNPLTIGDSISSRREQRRQKSPVQESSSGWQYNKEYSESKNDDSGYARTSTNRRQSFSELMSEVDNSLIFVRGILVMIDVVLVVYNATRTCEVVRTLYSGGFTNRRSPTVADIATLSCGHSSDAPPELHAITLPTVIGPDTREPHADGLVAGIWHAPGPARAAAECNGTRSAGRSVVLMTSKKVSGRGVMCCKTLVTTPTTPQSRGPEVVNCMVLTSPSSTTMCSAPSTYRDRGHRLPQDHQLQIQQPSNRSASSAVKDLQQVPAVTPSSPTSSTAKSREDYFKAVVGVLWRWACHRPPLLPTVGVLIGLVVLTQCVAIATDHLLGSTSSTSKSDAYGSSSEAVWLLMHASGFTDSARSLSANVHQSNQFMSISIDRAKSADIERWYRRHMTFELANLRGVLQVFIAEASNAIKRYQNDLGALTTMTSWSGSDRQAVCNNNSRTLTSFNSSAATQLVMLPCNFVELHSKLYSVCDHVTEMTSLASRFIDSITSGVGLVAGFADTLLVVVSVFVVISAAESCLMRLLRQCHLLPIRQVYLIPATVYDVCSTVFDDEDTLPGSNALTMEPTDHVDRCGVTRDTSGGLLVPSATARDRPKDGHGGSTLEWRGSVQFSTLSDGQRSQFSETKV